MPVKNVRSLSIHACSPVQHDNDRTWPLPEMLCTLQRVCIYPFNIAQFTIPGICSDVRVFLFGPPTEVVIQKIICVVCVCAGQRARRFECGSAMAPRDTLALVV